MQRFVRTESMSGMTPMSSSKAHHEWAAKIWRRMDRDLSEHMSPSELDCEEFRTVLKSLLAPNVSANTGGALYARAEMHVKQALSFCMRKADLNDDNKLSFAEFKSLLFYLKNTEMASETAALVFALFDLDGDECIDISEFREICRFYLGHKPTEVQFQAEWSRLDVRGEQYVTLSQYTKWLETSADPVFRQHAPKKALPRGSVATALAADEIASRAVGGSSASSKNRAPWNRRFNGSKNINEVVCPGMRSFFSRPQSLPELGRHYQTYRGFESQRRKHSNLRHEAFEHEEEGHSMARRSQTGGVMREHASGKITPWNDVWQTPVAMKPRYRPSTCDYRCLAPPPQWMYEEEFD
jgi:hypothetical protein